MGTWGHQSCSWRMVSPLKKTTPWKATAAPLKMWGQLSCHQTWQLLQKAVPCRYNVLPLRRHAQLCHRLQTPQRPAFTCPVWRSSSQPSMVSTGPDKLLKTCRTSCWLHGWSSSQTQQGAQRQALQQSSRVPCRAAGTEEQSRAGEAPERSAPSTANPHATACLAVKAPRPGLHRMLQAQAQEGKGEREEGVHLRTGPRGSRASRRLLPASNHSGSICVGPARGCLSFSMGVFCHRVLATGSCLHESSWTQESWGRDTTSARQQLLCAPLILAGC